MTSAVRNHVAAWVVLPVVAAANGAVRDLTYGKAIGKDLSHSVSCVPLATFILWWARVLARRWPISGPRAAIRVGLAWLALTLMFEFSLGAMRGVPLKTMLAEYNVLRGRLWAFIPAITAAAPAIALNEAAR